MAILPDKILGRIEELLASNPTSSVRRDDYVYGEQQAGCIAWIASAANLIERMVFDPNSAYRTLATSTQQSAAKEPYNAHAYALHMVSALVQIRADASAGILTDLETRVSGETIDDLLDHADQYLSEKRHEPAGVLAGVVFEDVVRRRQVQHFASWPEP